MRIIISPQAEKKLRKLQKLEQIAIAKKIRQISNDEGNIATKLKGYKDVYRVRIGDFRIIYRFIAGDLRIILIGHRKDIYEELKRLLGK